MLYYIILYGCRNKESKKIQFFWGLVKAFLRAPNSLERTSGVGFWVLGQGWFLGFKGLGV